MDREKLMPTHDERRQSTRHQTKLKAHLLFSVLLIETKTTRRGDDDAPRQSLNLVGQTRDISATGLGLVIPVEQIDEKYLTGEESTLQVELYLPTGPIEIRARPVRCERLSERQEKSIFPEGYLIGAQITEVSDPARFIEYLKTLD
jgi:hypothetical protein